MSLVFLSYARPDVAAAKRIASTLIAAGYDVWWDEQLPAHRTFYEVIEERLRAADAVIVLWSEDASQSQWVRAEADLARTLGTLVQASVDGGLPPLPFNQVQCAQLSDWNGESDHREWARVLHSVASLAASTESRDRASVKPAGVRRTRTRLPISALVGGAAVVAAASLWWLVSDKSWRAPTPSIVSTGSAPAEGVRFQRMTELVGIEEMPAASPDGKMVAYVAPANGRRQVWIQLLAGGSPLQVTQGELEAIHPRWLPDSSGLVYFTPAEAGGDGTLWEVSALGGAPRRIGTVSGGADVSHDGRRIAAFRRNGAELALVVLARDGSSAESERPLPPMSGYSTPRWSPDDEAIAFVVNEGGFTYAIHLVPAGGGEASVVARARNMRGLSWLPDGTSLVYASSTRSALAYPPAFHLRRVSRDGANDQPLTMGDVSYVEPDIAGAGQVFASQISMESDIWSFPVSGSPSENVAKGIRITRQTGQVQTPSVSPDGKQVAYLSDTGGHSNVWVKSIGEPTARQITFERDPDVLIGLPIWSPAGDRIVYVRRDRQGAGEWLVNPDGSAPRQIVPSGVSAQWSADGRWLYYFTPANASIACIERVPADGGVAEPVRCDASAFAVSSDAKTLYFTPDTMHMNLILKASPPDAAAVPLAEYAAERIPILPQGFVISPDDRWLALPLKDDASTDIWTISTEDGRFRRITEFGRPTLIGRQVSWTADGQSVLAALVEVDSNIVLLDGLVR